MKKSDVKIPTLKESLSARGKRLSKGRIVSVSELTDAYKNKVIPSDIEQRNQTVNKSDIDNLQELTKTKVIEYESGDFESHVNSEHFTNNLIGKKNGTYYRDIIFAIVQIRLPENGAEMDWGEILKHKLIISQKLNRNVGIHVATLDYYINIKKRVFNPKIIDAQEYVDTANRAITDELTRAYNRYFLDGELKRLFTFAKLFKRIFALMLFDIDHFKLYNDINGHLKGDIALIQIVNILHAVCGSNATVCRFGGEEFIVLLPDSTLKDAVEIATYIKNAVYDFRFMNEQQLPGERLSISGGVSVFSDEITDGSELIEHADKALYKAKNNGRNKIEIYYKSFDK